MKIEEIEFEETGKEMAEWAVSMTKNILNRKRLGELVGCSLDGRELDFFTPRGKKITILGNWDVLKIYVDKQLKFSHEYKMIYKSHIPEFKFC